jgi:hypothetical protein
MSCAAEVIRLLLNQGGEIQITEEVAKAAAGNSWNGKEVMQLLLNQGGEIQITEEVVKVAAILGEDPSTHVLESQPLLMSTDRGGSSLLTCPTHTYPVNKEPVYKEPDKLPLRILKLNLDILSGYLHSVFVESIRNIYSLAHVGINSVLSTMVGRWRRAYVARKTDWAWLRNSIGRLFRPHIRPGYRRLEWQCVRLS